VLVEARRVSLTPPVAFFGRRRLDEVSQILIERYKRERMVSKTSRGETRT
jgi:hypothetical protein